MLIRPATPADIPVVMALERAAPEAAHWSHAQYQEATGNSGPHRVALLIVEESIAEKEAPVRGFLVARELNREWEIENIVISAGVRRRGLGARLLLAFLDGARNESANAVFLEVRKSNLGARKLYENSGFVHSGSRRLYYREPQEDAELYRLIFL